MNEYHNALFVPDYDLWFSNYLLAWLYSPVVLVTELYVRLPVILLALNFLLMIHINKGTCR